MLPLTEVSTHAMDRDTQTHALAHSGRHTHSRAHPHTHSLGPAHLRISPRGCSTVISEASESLPMCDGDDIIHLRFACGSLVILQCDFHTSLHFYAGFGG